MTESKSRKMTEPTLYKGYLICVESFQRVSGGPWVPQYTATWQLGETTAPGFPVQQYQFNHSYNTQEEADQFALRYAQQWIDTYGSQKTPG